MKKQCDNCKQFKLMSNSSMLVIVGFMFIGGCMFLITMPLFLPIALLCFIAAPFAKGSKCQACHKQYK